MVMLWQPSLPERYTKATPEELARDITARRRELGSRLLILGHHYQTDEVIRHADLTGDSLKLSQQAAHEVAQRGAQYVVFCGVHFMAETADMLTPEGVSVILPDLSAGCSMADMADYDEAVEAWASIHAALGKGWAGRVVPVTYVNSSAAIKAFVGERGGAVCTSSNAGAVVRWALGGGDTPAGPGQEVKVLFLPDQHLGRNTAASLGIDVAQRAALYDPRKARGGEALGGMSAAQLRSARVVLWAGHCSVHKLFRPEHVEQVRAAEAGLPPAQRTTVIVHPECVKEVVDRADVSGSTEFIIRAIEGAPAGSAWAVGTEVHLVSRLSRAAAQRGVRVRILSDCQCLCTTMYRIDQPHLLWVLDNLAAGKVVNRVRVLPEAASQAMSALERMLRLAPSAPVAVKGAAAAALVD
ncbi:MAG: quinolinate synthase [Planctomyces sp.]|nr:quinolinate synthase [Planctomyces sp.]MBA4039746.1 quinolinate synthase [Planctomyces sp.]MBA4119894.1 quinolinate synthase [Isosphaera sp.]